MPPAPPRAARALRLLALTAALLLGTAQARAWTLAPGDPWPTLQPGDEVTLTPGTYEGPWEIAVPDVTVEADGARLRGPSDGSAVILAAPGIRLTGLRVRDAGSVADLYAPDAAVWMVGCDGCVVTDLDTRGVPAGLRIEASRDVRIGGAHLIGAPDGPGVTAYQAPGLHLADVTVEGFLDGIYVERSDGATLTGARVEGARRYGLHVMFSAGVTVQDATVRNGGVGSAVMYARDAVIRDATFTGHVGPLAYGLLVHEMHGARIEDVTLEGNTVGAMIVSSPDVTLRGATVRGSGTGLLVRRTPDAESSAVTLTGNRFSGNVADVAVDDPDASVTLLGNAFDAATRLDLDGDGVADAPYLPTSSYALLTTRTPDLSLFAFQPGVTAWERAEAAVPALRMATLHDPSPRALAGGVGGAASQAGRLVAIAIVLAAIVLGLAAGQSGRHALTPRGTA